MLCFPTKKKAVDLYFKYRKSSATVIRELGYPSRGVLSCWVKEFNDERFLHKKAYS